MPNSEPITIIIQKKYSVSYTVIAFYSAAQNHVVFEMQSFVLDVFAVGKLASYYSNMLTLTIQIDHSKIINGNQYCTSAVAICKAMPFVILVV